MLRSRVSHLPPVQTLGRKETGAEGKRVLRGTGTLGPGPSPTVWRWPPHPRTSAPRSPPSKSPAPASANRKRSDPFFRAGIFCFSFLRFHREVRSHGTCLSLAKSVSCHFAMASVRPWRCRWRGFLRRPGGAPARAYPAASSPSDRPGRGPFLSPHVLIVSGEHLLDVYLLS